MLPRTSEPSSMKEVVRSRNVEAGKLGMGNLEKPLGSRKQMGRESGAGSKNSGSVSAAPARDTCTTSKYCVDKPNCVLL
jgi:hypothetical protein